MYLSSLANKPRGLLRSNKLIYTPTEKWNRPKGILFQRKSATYMTLQLFVNLTTGKGQQGK